MSTTIPGGGADSIRVQVVVRRRASAGNAAHGELLAAQPLDSNEQIELKLAIDNGRAEVAWRQPGHRAWQTLDSQVDVRHLASVRSGLSTGMVVGPCAVRGKPASAEADPVHF